MKNIKITINSEDRIVVIPMQYDTDSDTLNLSDLQIEPMPKETEDVSKDVVFLLTNLIIAKLKEL